MSAIDLSQFNDDGVPERHPAPEQAPPAPPCVIQLVSGNRFVVKDIDAWSFNPKGVFATGFMNDQGDELDMLFWDAEIRWMNLDYSALKEFQDGENTGS